MTAALVTGGAGFVGAALVEELLSRGRRVTVLDVTPRAEAWRLRHLLTSADLRYETVDVRDAPALRDAVGGHDVVYHLSSNTENRADRAGLNADFDITTGGTVRLLQALAESPPSTVVLASSQLVLGNVVGTATEETCTAGPTSRFAAGKLAAEAFLSAYAHEHSFRAAACRLSNVVGPTMRRGIVHDLVHRLRDDPARIRVLGDGRQERSFLHVTDCVRAMVRIAESAPPRFGVYNVCNTGTTSVATVAETVADLWPGPRPSIEFAGGERGWSGDVPTLRVLPERLTRLGWRPQFSSDDAVRLAAESLIADADREAAS